jgi:hypothetical protein
LSRITVNENTAGFLCESGFIDQLVRPWQLHQSITVANRYVRGTGLRSPQWLNRSFYGMRQPSGAGRQSAVRDHPGGRTIDSCGSGEQG